MTLNIIIKVEVSFFEPNIEVECLYLHGADMSALLSQNQVKKMGIIRY